MALDEEYKALPPAEAVAFFEQKLALPTRRWTDLLREQHDRAFVVAGAMRMELLGELQQAVAKALAEGTTLEQFRKDFDEIVGRYGWPFENRPDTPAYRDWRTRTIYRTNLSTAYAAGRLAQMRDPEVLAARPYWLYRHGDSLTPREQHLGWDGLVLPADDPWWDTHYPPNGWGCSCRAFSLSRAEVAERGLKVASQAPADEPYEWTNPNTGEVEEVPRGIDPGWNYTPGESWLRAQTPRFLEDWPAQVQDVPAGRVYGDEPARLPDVRRVEASLVLPDGLSDETYAEAFLREFGAEIGRAVFFEDVTGERLVISDLLLKNASGAWKVQHQGRAPYLRLLAKTLKEPDEIWVVMEPLGAFKAGGATGKWGVFRQYVARWEIEAEGEVVRGTSIFMWGRAGWAGETTFRAKGEAQLEKRRKGVRLYRRPDGGSGARR